MEAARLRSAFDSAKAASACLLHYRKDGLTFWNHVFTLPILDESGRYAHKTKKGKVRSWAFAAFPFIMVFAPSRGGGFLRSNACVLVHARTHATTTTYADVISSVCIPVAKSLTLPTSSLT